MSRTAESRSRALKRDPPRTQPLLARNRVLVDHRMQQVVFGASLPFSSLGVFVLGDRVRDAQ